MHQQIDEGKESLVQWVEDEEVKKEIARMSDSDPYVDLVGEDTTGTEILTRTELHNKGCTTR